MARKCGHYRGLWTAGEHPDGAGQGKGPELLGEAWVNRQDFVQTIGHDQKARLTRLRVRCQEGLHLEKARPYSLQQVLLRGRRRLTPYRWVCQLKPGREGRQESGKKGARAVKGVTRMELVEKKPELIRPGVTDVGGKPGHQQRFTNPGSAKHEADTCHFRLPGVAIFQPGLEYRAFSGATYQVLLNDTGLAEKVAPLGVFPASE